MCQRILIVLNSTGIITKEKRVKKFKIVVIGGGTGGISSAAHLLKSFAPKDVAVIEPHDTHYYQPFWTLVGAGVVDKKVTAKPMASVMPSGTTWIKEKVSTFEPKENKIVLANGEEIAYDFLVVSAGIKMDWQKIKGLKGNLGKNGIVSIYNWDSVDATWEAMKNFEGGTAVFTFPPPPFKCAGAPQKIMWLAEEWFRMNNVREKTRVVFLTAGEAIFGVEKYKKALEKIVIERGIECVFHHVLDEVDAENKTLKAKDTKTGEIQEIKYDMLHVVPPMSAPDFIKESPLSSCEKARNEEYAKLAPPADEKDHLGYIEVDKFTTQHVVYKNIFSLGDVSSMPNSKTGAAIRKQAPVLAKNLYALSQGKELKSKYQGYASCPLVLDRSHVMLAEFGYEGKLMETFPFNQAKPRRTMWWLKRYVLPVLYWNFMLKGLA
jgi:sulfide:quinone oxidoreductase